MKKRVTGLKKKIKRETHTDSTATEEYRRWLEGGVWSRPPPADADPEVLRWMEEDIWDRDAIAQGREESARGDYYTVNPDYVKGGTAPFLLQYKGGILQEIADEIEFSDEEERV